MSGDVSASIVSRMVSRRVIKRFAAEVAVRLKPKKIILFGSYAYGKPGDDSDVDLLVVMPGKGRPQDRALEIRERVAADFPMDLIVRTPSELRQRLSLGDWFLKEIVEKGIVLYDAAHT